MKKKITREKGHICLADFGLSKLLDETDETKTFCGSQGYLGLFPSFFYYFFLLSIVKNNKIIL